MFSTEGEAALTTLEAPVVAPVETPVVAPVETPVVAEAPVVAPV
jgi:hypothetical protein